MTVIGPNEIEILRDASNELRRLAELFGLPSLEPMDFIETLLPMANKDSSLQEKAEAYHLLKHGQIIGFPEDVDSSELPEPTLRRDVGGSDPNDLHSTEAYLEQSVVKFWAKSSAHRHEFRQVLDRVFQGEPEAAQEYLQSAHEDLVLVPVIAWVDSQPDLTFKFCPIGIRGALGHAMALLLDRKSNHFRYLRVCSLAACGNYFLSRRTRGKPRKLKYCCDSHISAGATKKGAARSKIYRVKAAKKAKHKRT